MPKIAALTFVSLLSIVQLNGESTFGGRVDQTPKSFPLLNWDGGTTCRAKGRLQDRQYCDSKIMDQIIAQGTNAIPVLISQLTDTRELKEPIFDFWGPMTVGDVANAILDSLFTDFDWKTFNMPGLEVLGPKCQDTAYMCKQILLKTHGRKFIQDQWFAAWNSNKGRIYWNSEARCFRLTRNKNG